MKSFLCMKVIDKLSEIYSRHGDNPRLGTIPNCVLVRGWLCFQANDPVMSHFRSPYGLYAGCFEHILKGPHPTLDSNGAVRFFLNNNNSDIFLVIVWGLHLDVNTKITKGILAQTVHAGVWAHNRTRVKIVRVTWCDVSVSVDSLSFKAH